MHATAANRVTCAAPRCAQPGTVAVLVPIVTPCGVWPDQTVKYHEGAAIVDYCQSCADKLLPTGGGGTDDSPGHP